MDVAGTERVDLRALGGGDRVAAADLSATGVRALHVDLAATIGGDDSDGERDTVEIAGSAAPESVEVAGDPREASVSGLATAVVVARGGSEEDDALVVRTGGGDDVLSASRLEGPAIGLVLDGGDGDDAIDGSEGSDVLDGGDGDDAVSGAQGFDVAALGAGDDRFTLEPGDGSGRVDGEGGADVLAFTGSAVRDVVELAADGGRARLESFQQVTDAGGVEGIDVRPPRRLRHRRHQRPERH